MTGLPSTSVISSSRWISWVAAMLLSATSVTMTPCSTPRCSRSATSLVKSCTCKPNFPRSSGRACPGLAGSLEARAISLGSSPVVMWIFMLWPFRHTVSSTFCPTRFFRISCCSWESVFTDFPSTSVMTSIGLRSLLFAGASASIVRTTTPLSRPLNSSRMDGSSPSDSIRIPSHGRTIL